MKRTGNPNDMKATKLKVMGEMQDGEEKNFFEVVERIRSFYAKQHPNKTLLGFCEAQKGVGEQRHQQKDNRLCYLAFILKEADLWNLYLEELDKVLEHGLPKSIIKENENVDSFGQLCDHCLAANNAVNRAMVTNKK